METVWQVVIIMITATICMGALSRIITRSILEEVDAYKTKRAAVTAKICRDVIEQMTKALKEIVEKSEKERNELIKELKKTRKDLDDFDVTI